MNPAHGILHYKRLLRREDGIPAAAVSPLPRGSLHSGPSCLVSPGGGKKGKKLCQGHSPGAQANERLALNRKITERSHPHTSPQGPAQQRLQWKGPKGQSVPKDNRGDRNKDIRGSEAPGS